jgi:hypothetical protein
MLSLSFAGRLLAADMLTPRLAVAAVKISGVAAVAPFSTLRANRPAAAAAAAQPISSSYTTPFAKQSSISSIFAQPILAMAGESHRGLATRAGTATRRTGAKKQLSGRGARSTKAKKAPSAAASRSKSRQQAAAKKRAQVRQQQQASRRARLERLQQSAAKKRAEKQAAQSRRRSLKEKRQRKMSLLRAEQRKKAVLRNRLRRSKEHAIEVLVSVRELQMAVNTAL